MISIALREPTRPIARLIGQWPLYDAVGAGSCDFRDAMTAASKIDLTTQNYSQHATLNRADFNYPKL
jgi:hypothetical protein